MFRTRSGNCVSTLFFVVFAGPLFAPLLNSSRV
jgi:hypothetical protein